VIILLIVQYFSGINIVVEQDERLESHDIY
jgi:hypothetical protein